MVTTTTLVRIKDALREHGGAYSFRDLAELTGLPVRTVAQVCERDSQIDVYRPSYGSSSSPVARLCPIVTMSAADGSDGRLRGRHSKCS